MTMSRRELTKISLGAMAVGALGSGMAEVAQGRSTPDTSSPNSFAAARAKGGILAPERFVPTPKSVSPQAFLSHEPPVGAMPIPTSLDDAEGWQKFKEEGDHGMVLLTRAYVERYPGKVTTHQLSASKLYEIIPNNLDTKNASRAILLVHGGGWVNGGGEAAANSGMQLAGMSRTKVFSLDYRMLPEFVFPAPLEDTVEAYRLILERHSPKAVGIYGPSAGANLAPAAILMARDLGLPLPGACAIHSCPSDLERDGDSTHTNFWLDTVLKEWSMGGSLYRFYGGGHDPKDPLLSPIYADYSKGFPPTILTSGTRDLLLSSTVLLHRALLAAGVRAQLHVWEAMTHAPFFSAPEEDDFYKQIIDFLLGNMSSD